jgi:nucleoside-diphosphate-sugar epimerase
MRVLVTGGAGFIGGNLVRALVARGDEVVVLDNLATYHSLAALEGVADDVVFVHGDVRCAEDLVRCGRAPFDRVYHLAASFANQLSVEHPLLDARTNVDGTRNVVAFAREVGCGLLVYAGTSSSYGDAPVPTDEEMPSRPQTPYARNKLEGERCVQSSGLPYAVLRMFNVYGPGDPPGRYRNAIPNMMRTLDRDGARLSVFGADSTRDFTYVADVVRLLLDAERAAGQTVNVGTGVETPIVALAREILRLFRLAGDRLAIEPRRDWDGATRRCASTASLERLFGYRPAMPLPHGLRETARWLHRAGYIARTVWAP